VHDLTAALRLLEGFTDVTVAAVPAGGLVPFSLLTARAAVIEAARAVRGRRGLDSALRYS